MPHVNPKRPCAPYAIFVGSSLVAHAPSLLVLYRIVDSISTRAFEAEKLAEVARARAVASGSLWGAWRRAQPLRPCLHVVDARGIERQDLCSPWRIRWEFGSSDSALARATDPGWDGDIRPRGIPIEGTGRRVPYGRAHFRRPRTQRARRLAFHEKSEGEPPFRGAQRAPAQPTAWEDLPRRAQSNHSWKCHRKKQWRQ